MKKENQTFFGADIDRKANRTKLKKTPKGRATV